MKRLFLALLVIFGIYKINKGFTWLSKRLNPKTNQTTEAIIGLLSKAFLVWIYGEKREDRAYKKYPVGYNYRVRFSPVVAKVVFDTSEEANEVLTSLLTILSDYGFASVADFYDLAGYESNYTDSEYGWNTIKHFRVRNTPNGYIIELPEPKIKDVQYRKNRKNNETSQQSRKL